jgi:hypothetical protein
MRKLLIVLLVLLVPTVASALGGKSYFEFRDRGEGSKFTTYLEFNQELPLGAVGYGSYLVDSLYYDNGTLIPDISTYSAGIRVRVWELDVEVWHAWEHNFWNDSREDFTGGRIGTEW